MAEETTGVPGAINIAAQYPTATKIDNGTAYDVSGKALGSVEGQAAEPEPEKGDDFFAKLGGKPVSAQSDVKDDDFFAKLGGQPVRAPGEQVPQTSLSKDELTQKAYQTAGGSTVGDTAKEIMGHINEAASQGLGRNAPEMWNNIKDTVKKHFGPNATDDVVTGITNWVGNQIDEQYGPHGAVAKYSPDTDLGKRAIAAIPMMGPALASVIENYEKGNYAEAALTAGKTGAQLAVAGKGGEIKAGAIDAAKSAYMMDKLEASTAVYNDLQNGLNSRLREFEKHSKQAIDAEADALNARKTKPGDIVDKQKIDAADERASAARANASKAQKALEQAQEARDQHGVKMRQIARQQQGPRAAKKADPRRAKDIAGAHEDFQSMAPPTATGPAAYDVDDLSTARTYIEDAHSTKPLTSVQDHFDALDSASKSIDAEIDPYLQKYANEPFPDRVNVKMEVADKLAEQDKISPGFLQKGLNELSKYNITDMSVAEADKLRETLNAENRSIMSKHFPGSIELATKLKTDPEFAANYYALESIRNGLDETLQDHDVEGIRDKRRDQQSIIKVKNAVERQLTRGDQTVRGTGQSGPMRKAAAQFAEKGATVIGAKIGGIKGAVAGDILGEKLGRAISPGDLTKNQLAARTMRTRGAGRVKNQMLGGEGTPSVLPIDKLPPAPNSAMTPEDVKYIQREQSPLHAELSTHYPDAYGDDASYENLEKRFKEDIDDKTGHGIALEPAEKTLLGKIKQQDFADALKLKQEAAEAAAKGKQVGKATLPENAEPAMHIPGNIPHGMSPAQVMGHEIVHAIVGKEKGIVITEIRSHNHSANVKSGNFASAKIDWEASKMTKPDGNIDWNKVKARMPDIAATYVAGGVANDLWHNVPFTENLGLGMDLRALHEMMDTAGFSKAERSRIIATAADDARLVVERPGIRDIVEQHAEVREPGLSDKLHIGPERMEQIYQDVKGGANEPTTGKSSRPNGANDRGTEEHGAGREGQVQGRTSEGVRKASEGSPEGKAASAAKPAESAADAGKPNEPAVSAVTQGGHAGGGVASEEELARPGSFVKIGRGGAATYQGKTPDFPNLAAGEAGYQVRPGGKYELKAGQETPATKRGVESYAREVHGAAEPASPAMSAERLPKVDNLRVPQERTTGEHDDAIRQGGAIPGGIQKGDVEIGIPDLALFHDPTTGSTLALPTDKISPENVKAQLKKSRDMYIAAEDRKAAAANQPESPALSKDSASHEHDREWQAKYGNPQIAAHEANGGSTFSPEGENLAGKNLHAVGSYPERTLEVDKLTPEVLAKFKADNADVLSKGDHAVGTWKDPDTGKTVLDISKTIADRDEAIAAGKAANQKAIYHLGGDGTIPTGGTGTSDLLMADRQRQFPLKRSFQVEVGYSDQPAHTENIGGFSNEDALKTARKQFPDANQWSVKGSENLNPPPQGYSVPTGKPLSSPPQGEMGKTSLQSMRHELGHAMVGQNEGMSTKGMLRHTHPDAKGTVAAVVFDGRDFMDPTTRQIRPDRVQSVIRALMGGVASDELFNDIPRSANHNFTQAANPRGDGAQAYKILRQSGLSHDEIVKAMHQAIDDGKQHLTKPEVSGIIKENENTREPGLSTQYHYSPERLKSMADEANRRIQSGEYGTTGINNGAVGGQGTPGPEGNVAGAASSSPGESEESLSKAAAVKLPESPALSSDRVSTRVPGGKNAKENALQGEPLTIGRTALEASPQKLQDKFAQKARSISGVKIPKNITDNGKIFDRFTRHVADNLKWVYNQVAPDTQIAHAKWYESANKLAQDLADKHGFSQQQTAGIVAAMSPQMDWDSNVSLAKRVADIYKNHSDEVVTPEMIQKGRDIIAGSRKGKAKTANANLEKLLGGIEGKKIGELQGTQRAAAVRLYDEVNNPREFHRIDPATGDEAELRTNVDGSSSAVPWGSFDNIEKALSIADDGSRENISKQVGESHKVRNFYNNIIDPTNPDDVTIDTHAVGAGTIMPLSGNAKEVTDNFGGGGKSMQTGVKGTYPLYAEGYRLAAKELGLKTRELQSVTWEKIRDMFPAEWKTADNLARVKAEWKKYTDGKQSVDDTRNNILQMSEQGKADSAARQKTRSEKKTPGKISALDFLDALGHNKGTVDAGAAILGGKK